MKKNLPVITEEELKELRHPREEFIEEAIREFKEWVDKVDAQYDRSNNDEQC